MRSVVILGSTGSIGRSALDIIDSFPDRLRATGLAAGRNADLLCAQVRKYKPLNAVLAGVGYHEGVAGACAEVGCRYLRGPDALAELAGAPEADVVLAAITGLAGIRPTFAAIAAGKRIALANKEALVAAGELFVSEARRSGAEILPVDSEHNAIFQCLQGQRRGDLQCVILCSSGGPFRQRSLQDLSGVSVKEALDHPCWDMGRKISIDSATMMNKGLEMIEARWLFDLKSEQIKVVVHPQSVVHSLVEFVDGSLLAQLGVTDMKLPLRYCFSYPDRWRDNGRGFDLVAASPLEFHEPDVNKFPALRLAEAALREGDSLPAALCAADEVAVEAFLRGRIAFLNIVAVVEKVLGRHEKTSIPDLETLAVVDRKARESAERQVAKLAL